MATSNVCLLYTAISFFLLAISTKTLANPYGYYGPSYSRTRRDPTAWDGGYGGVVQQQQPIPVVPNVGTYAGNMDPKGMGMGGTIGQGRRKKPNMFALPNTGQYGQVDTGLRSPMLGGVHDNLSQHKAMGGLRHSTDHSSFQPIQQQYPSGVDSYGSQGGMGDRSSLPDGWDSDAPPECVGRVCDNLDNCINVTTNDTCCPKCIQYGCICEGYQVYDCQRKGFKDGMVPEGNSYAVADGTTVCSCPPGGGSITCSFHDPASSKCPERQPNCIKAFLRSIDNCEICEMVGCVTETGDKAEAGMNIEKPPCSMCYCPQVGGDFICGIDPDCEKELGKVNKGNLAMESSIREVSSQMGLGEQHGGFGYDNRYNNYPDYGGRYVNHDTGMSQSSSGIPVIPPLMALPDAKKDSLSESASDKTTGAEMSENSAGQQGSAGFNYQRESYGLQGQYGYGYGVQGNFDGDYLGFRDQQQRMGSYPGGYYPNGYGVENSNGPSKSLGGKTAPDVGDTAKDSSKTEDSALHGATGQLQGSDSPLPGQNSFQGYPYLYPQNGGGGYPDYRSLRQPSYNPSQMGGYPSYANGQATAGNSQPGSLMKESDTDTGAETGQSTANENSDTESTNKHGTDQDSRYAGVRNMGYPYENYGQNDFYKFRGYQAQYPPHLGSPDPSENKDQQQADISKSEGQENQSPVGPAGGYQSNLGVYNPYAFNQPFPGYDNAGYGSISQVRSKYDPVDPSLMKVGSPEAKEQHPAQSEDEELSDGGSRRIRDPLSLLQKGRFNHEKSFPTQKISDNKYPAVQKSEKQVSYENVLSQCCLQGRQWALQHDTCQGISITVTIYEEICAVAQEKCCLEAKEQQYCQGGIDTARSMAACDVPANLGGTCGGNEFKTCCDCCAMGLKALGLGLSCDVKIFGEPCNRSYMECCQAKPGASSPPQVHQPDNATPSAPHPKPAAKETSPDDKGGEPTGPRCVTDSECQQLCSDTELGMICSCRRGYRLHVNKKDCVDVNECVLNTHTCSEYEFCFNREGRFICQRRISCGTGYEMTERNTCEDIDECELNVHDCSVNMECDNIRGSYRCIPKLCDGGFFTDATGQCIDIDECRAGDYICPERATCINTDGSYECHCPIGLQTGATSASCEDINECENGIAHCSDGATCINTEGSFFCREPPTLRCLPGYHANEDATTCVDTDECAEGTHTCQSGSTCINEEGGFRCQDPLICPEGLKPDENQDRCLDINECEDPSRHRCDVGGRCLNLPKTFKCVCNSGYVRATATDGVPTCVDVDECATSLGEKCKYKCRNTPGSYECYCPDGYKLANFGSTCEDIDECAQSVSPCPAEETCFNTYGSHRCVAVNCPEGYTRISNTKRTNLKCLRRCNKKPCGTIMYNYLHISIPSFVDASASNPKLVLRILQVQLKL